MKHIIGLSCISLCLLSAAAFAQDECASAVQIFDGLTSGSNVGATTSSPTGSCGLMGSDIWYSYQACGSGTVTVSLCESGAGANYDTVLAAFSGTCGSLTQIACNDDTCGFSSKISFPATPGTTYYIAVGGFGGKQGNFTLSVACPPPNDECTGAIAITDGVTTGTTALATFSTPSLNCSGGGGGDVWYAYTATCTGKATASLCSNGGATDYYSVLAAYSGACGALNELTCDSTSCGYGAEIEFPAVAGTTYYIRVCSYYSFSPINFSVSLACAAVTNWRTKALVPAGGIESPAVGLIGNKIYMSHGYSGNFGYTTALWTYDLQSDSWSSGPSASSPRLQLVGAAAGGKFYAIGGSYFGSFVVGDVEVFDPSTSTWSTGPSMPTARAGMGAAVLNGLIHVIGGRTGSYPRSGTPLDVHEVFDPATGVWSSLAPLPVPVGDDTATVAVGGKIYVFGGWFGGSGTSSLNQIYDAATNSWSIGANMPTPRDNAAAGVFDSGIWAGMPVVIGGISSSFFGDLDVVEIYNPATNTWITGPVKPTNAAEMGAAAVSTGCAIHCIGRTNFNGARTVHEAMVAAEPAATSRNAGANPESLTITSLPVLGGTFAASVDLTTTGHTKARLMGYFSPATRTLPGGQVLLVNTADPHGGLLHFPLTSGPIATFVQSVPNDLSLCGLHFSVQALHVLGVEPFALSNAQDVVIGD